MFPPNRLLLIFEAKEMMILFFFLFFSRTRDNPWKSIVCSMMHGRALKRSEKKKKICVQYRLIVFLFFFCLFSFSRFWCPSDRQTAFFIFFFFLNLRTRSCLWQKHLFLCSYLIPRDTSTNTWSNLPILSLYSDEQISIDQIIEK